MFQLHRATRSLSIELEDFTRGKFKEYTKQAYSKARMKISHQGYKELNRLLIDEYYKGEDYKTYKGYRLLGMDGTIIQLPEGKQIEEEFGRINKINKNLNGSISIVVYDLLNQFIIDTELYSSSADERISGISLLERIANNNKKEKEIIVADRGFPSLYYFLRLQHMGYDFVVRYNSKQFLKETRGFVKSKKKDEEVTISIKYGRKRKDDIKLQEFAREIKVEEIKLRIVKVKLKTGETEYLITSLLREKGFKSSDFKRIYKYRWEIEEKFKYLKNTLEIENFSGKTPEAIRQDYHSCILISNIHNLMLEEAQENLNKKLGKSKKYKYKKYKINKNISYGFLKKKIQRILETDNLDWEKEYDALIKLMLKHLIPIIKNRHYKKRIRRSSIKYTITKRRAA